MSGYLQRLASSVLKPALSIHPILGSVFSAAQLERRAEHEELVARRHSAAETATPAPAAPVRRAEEAGMPVPHDVPYLPASERTVFQPLVGRRQTEETELPRSPYIQATDDPGGAWSDRPDPIPEPAAPVSRQPRIGIADSGKPEQQRTTEPPIDAVHEQEPSRAVTPDVPRREAENTVYHPLIEENFRRPTPPTILRETFRDGRKKERGDSPRREAPAHREQDEIQIHIGRIEVVAAPVSPVRAAPKPVRPSPDLGDYLKRRNGRA